MDFKYGIKPKEVELRHPDNPIVYLDLNIGEEKVGRIVIELFKNLVPVTAENFRALCTGEKGVGDLGTALHYKNTYFHKLVPYFMYQGGDIVNFNGSSGQSIYGPEFSLENFTVLHDQPGILSMVNVREMYCNSQFIITSTECPHLDGISVAFGRVIKGFSCVQEIQKVTRLISLTIGDYFQLGEVEKIDHIPRIKCMISDCGQLDSSNWDFFDEDDGLPHGPTDLTMVPEFLTATDLSDMLKHILEPGDKFNAANQRLKASSKYRKTLRYIEWIDSQLDGLNLIDSDKNDLISFINFKRIYCYLELAKDSNDAKKSIEYCDKVLKQDADNGLAHYLKGVAQLKQKDYDNAQASQDAALKLSPKNSRIMSELNKIREAKAKYLTEEKKVYKKMFSFK